MAYRYFILKGKLNKTPVQIILQSKSNVTIEEVKEWAKVKIEKSEVTEVITTRTISELNTLLENNE